MRHVSKRPVCARVIIVRVISLHAVIAVEPTAVPSRPSLSRHCTTVVTSNPAQPSRSGVPRALPGCSTSAVSLANEVLSVR